MVRLRIGAYHVSALIEEQHPSHFGKQSAKDCSTSPPSLQRELQAADNIKNVFSGVRENVEPSEPPTVGQGLDNAFHGAYPAPG